MMWKSLILGVGMATAAGSGLAQAACSARTPEQAVGIESVATTKHSASASSSYYRLAKIIVDPELHRRWALIADCTHPERPMEIVALSGHVVVPNVDAQPAPSSPSISGVARPSVPTEIVPRQTNSSSQAAARPSRVAVAKTLAQKPSTTTPMILAGDLVRLWSSDGNVRLEMAVVSLEYGRIGQIIHVRRPGRTALLAGVVVGKDSAELIP
jgi:hypothetical protein